MLDIEQINSTIQELENSSTTFDTCIKLASLYIVKEQLNKSTQTMVELLPNTLNDEVENELADILPHYRKYCEVKRNWQMGNADKEHVIQEMQYVCNEVQEFVQTLYSHTSMPEERQYLAEMSSYLYNVISH